MRRQGMFALLFATAGGLACGAGAVEAQPAEAPPSGFVVRYEASIAAPPATVYHALTERVGEWWDPEHTYSGDSRNLSLDAVPGGCFCEKLADGGGIEHMRVVYVAPDKALRLSGALGPLQEYGLAGSLTWALADSAGATRVTMGYAVGGYMEGGFEGIAPIVGQVLETQLHRLKRLVETGDPAGDQRLGGEG